MLRTRTSFRGFTLTELLVAIGTIIVLLAILLPALSTMRTQAGMAESQSNLRQVGTWLQMYATDNREVICPTEFDYSENSYPGHVRNTSEVNEDHVGPPNAGTWTDILWTVYGNFSFPQLSSLFGHDYSTDSPDILFYDFLPDYAENPFRSAALNTSSPGGDNAVPFGNGARAEERGHPGYFAGNNFFNAAESSDTFSGWFVTGQIKAPSRSLYAIDSFYGETIESAPGEEDAWEMDNPLKTLQIDFRYADACLMLMLDGSVRPEGVFQDLAQLETSRGIRVRNLTQ